MPKPLVSFLVPCYHAKGFVGKAIGCALRQTYDQVEVILAPDDGCSYEEVGQKFSSPRLRILPPGPVIQSGAGAARNRAIDAAQGDFFAMLDADDTIPDDYLEKIMDAAARDGAAVANTWYTQDGEVHRSTNFQGGRLTLSTYGRTLASMHPVVHRSLEPGFIRGFAEDVVRDGIIIAHCRSVKIVDSYYDLHLRNESVCGVNGIGEVAVQRDYDRILANLTNTPSAIGAHILSPSDQELFARLFQLREDVSKLYSREGVGLSYQGFIKGRESEFADRFGFPEAGSTAIFSPIKIRSV